MYIPAVRFFVASLIVLVGGLTVGLADEKPNQPAKGERAKAEPKVEQKSPTEQSKTARPEQAGEKQAGDDKEKKSEPSFWMKQKLNYSERILAGLVSDDMDVVHQNASAMKGLNRIEHFVRRDPPAYRTQLNVFQFSLDELLRTSKDDNVDGATLAFAQMTISCVNCHKLLRKN